MVERLEECQQLVLKMLDAIEENLKEIKRLNRNMDVRVDISCIQQGVVDVYETVEKCECKEKTDV